MTLDVDVRESPNHDDRPAGVAVDILLLHYTGMVSAQAALDRLCDPSAKVSSHWLVDEDGRIVRLVEEQRRAWHAGLSCWKGATDINARSVGIEIVNPGHEFGYRDFPECQIDAVIALARDILARHAVPPERVLAHSDVAPSRKADPGERFPWERLHRAGIGHWVASEPVSAGPVLAPGDQGPAVAVLRGELAGYGYCLEAGDDYDPATQTVVAAFQRHFRPARVDGVADVSTRATLARLRAGLTPDAGRAG